MPTREELDKQAKERDVPVGDARTKGDVEEALAAADALGPAAPEGGDGPQFDRVGKPNVGVQPKTADDIPEAGR